MLAVLFLDKDKDKDKDKEREFGDKKRVEKDNIIPPVKIKTMPSIGGYREEEDAHISTLVAWDKGGEKDKDDLLKSLRFGDSWVEALRVLVAARGANCVLADYRDPLGEF